MKFKKVLKRFGGNVKEVIISSKVALKHDSRVLFKEGKKKLKNKVKLVKYRKKNIREIKKGINWGETI